MQTDHAEEGRLDAADAAEPSMSFDFISGADFDVTSTDDGSQDMTGVALMALSEAVAHEQLPTLEQVNTSEQAPEQNGRASTQLSNGGARSGTQLTLPQAAAHPASQRRVISRCLAVAQLLVKAIHPGHWVCRQRWAGWRHRKTPGRRPRS